ncbi:MAG: adenylate/guanylate cyclase domain-containing protein [Alphaproteobacteria bacterium]|nr:adenylate/guanylate cyclase domain-containing protein [Alphaproteobacteria bacterium]
MTATETGGELRLFLEELCCDLCRMRHVAQDGLRPEEIRIAREVQLIAHSAFADIVVTVPNAPSYFVEIKYGLSLDETVRSIRRKYAVNHRASCARLIIVVRDLDPAALNEHLRDCVCSTLDIEIWNEARLLSEIKLHYGVEIETLAEHEIIGLHRSIQVGTWKNIFDHDYYETLASALLWHFSSWTLRRLQNQHGGGPGDIWQTGHYLDIAVVMADISSFSAYVRDTKDNRITQQILTAFYSQTRHAVHEYGGMLYQFVGDEVVGLFGFPDRKPGYVSDALSCAKALLDIGASTSEHWQRQIDNVQEKHGVHVGVAMGALNLMPLRPFARSHIGFIGDALNIAARLMGNAMPGEIVVSNTFYNALEEDRQVEFAENPPIEAKNVGNLRCWRRATTV